MGMKNKSQSKQVVALRTDSDGRVEYEAVLGHSAGSTVFARPEHAKSAKFTPEELLRPSQEEAAATAEKTRQELEKIVGVRVKTTHITEPTVTKQENTPTYIKYTPSQSSQAFNSGAKTRTIRMVEAQVDPMEPPKFKSVKAPRGPSSPPAPVMHSPPKKLSQQDHLDWKIPPCISNWKNNKGFTIALDKRLAADGRGLQDTQISDRFARLSESLNIAESEAREEIKKRNEFQKMMLEREKSQQERKLMEIAEQARASKSHVSQAPDNVVPGSIEEYELESREEEKKGREKLLEDQRRDLIREHRMNKYKGQRGEAERDVTEAMALGMKTGPARGDAEALFDKRLFNQTEGLDQGFGQEEDYNLYAKPLFSGEHLGSLYRPKGDSETYGMSEEDMEKIAKTDRFQPDKGFSGTERTAGTKSEPRNKPIEFEKEKDVFGMEQLFSAAKSSSHVKDSLNAIGGSRDSSGGKRFVEASNDGDSKRQRK
eukprot:TRINITY_DN2036_c0_g1_i1.p1 TRINITY_DN2036_c0_g1~~TRINITY_DN2036_c0_g1_i1.p1  ORF type:complete len:563 (+),score=165.76 TRINITY_DN2036_c0_g1_i1:235-1689(+)